MKRPLLRRFAALGLEPTFIDLHLLSLLNVRDVWGLSVGTEIPRLTSLPGGNPPVSEGPLAEAAAIWSEQWNRRLGELAKVPLPPLVVGDREITLELLEQDADPWYGIYSDLGFELGELASWYSRLFDLALTGGVNKFPELNLLPELEEACRKGMQRFVLLQVDGYFAHWFDASTLVLSQETRAHLPAYRCALGDQPA